VETPVTSGRPRRPTDDLDVHRIETWHDGCVATASKTQELFSMRRSPFALFALLGLVPLLGSSCTTDWTPVDELVELESLSAADLLEEAGVRHGVPPDLVAAVAWHASSFTTPEGDHGHGAVTYGWMGLDEAGVASGALLTGLPADEVRSGREANLLAGAALLSDLAASLGADVIPDYPGADWWPVLVAWPDFEDEWMAHEWALEVFGTLQEGLDVVTEDGDRVVIEPWDLPDLEEIEPLEGPYEEDGEFADASLGYPGRDRWYPAHWSNYTSPRPGGKAAIHRVVIHTTEGAYHGSLSWFRNPSANTSAHYTIRRSDGEVTMQVKDGDMAWHACGGHNGDTIGIEHEGHAWSSSQWTEALLDSSARLSGWLAARYNIPVDRDHFVGHGEITPSYCPGRSDPGPYFPWGRYLEMVRHYKSKGHGASTPARAKIWIDEPHAGQQVGNPFVMRIRTKRAHHVDIWIGARRIFKGVEANPAERSWYIGGNAGWRRIKVRAKSKSGRIKGRKSVRVRVRKTSDDIEPTVRKVHKRVYALTSEVAGHEVHRVRYWANGRPLRDKRNDRLRARGPDFLLVKKFQPKKRYLLVARSYDDQGRLRAEGWTHFRANTRPGPPVEVKDVHTEAIAGRIVRFTADATRGVEYVKYRSGGQSLDDMVTGDVRAEPDEFELWHEFEASGAQTVRVRAFDRAGELRDIYEVTVHVPSPTLVVGVAPAPSPGVWSFDADAPVGTERVLVYADGVPLTDAATGQPFAAGPAFELDASLPPGPVWLEAVALDPVGNVLGAWSGALDAS